MTKLICVLLTLLPSFSFAESLKLSIQKRHFVRLNELSAQKYNINLQTILSAAGTENKDNVFIEVNDNDEIIDLGIFDQNVFAEARVDWRS